MSHRRILGRVLTLAALPLLPLAGCDTWDSITDSVGSPVGRSSSASPERAKPVNSSVATRASVAVSDEPLAAQVGAGVLSEQGSAADAVTAMFFTLATTYPVAAGLGGGGICLV